MIMLYNRLFFFLPTESLTVWTNKVYTVAQIPIVA